MTQVSINTRVLGGTLTGVQRYTQELVARFDKRIATVRPALPVHGLTGHAWEQFVLPARLHGNLLFSPSNTGPLAVSRQVVTIHDLSVFDAPEGFGRRFARWYRFLLPRLARRVRHVIAVSHFTKERLIVVTGLHPSKVTVIPSGIDNRFFRATIGKPSNAAAALGLPGPNYVLSLGSLVPRKNLGGLLKAWARVLPYIPQDVWLVLAGGTGQPNVFRTELALDALPDRVYLAGRVDEDLLPGLYAGAIAFAFPSLYEGFGFPPLEAMAAGTPVLASNSTSLPEVTGRAALLVDAKDIDEIAYGLLRLLQDANLRRALRDAGETRARLFTWEACADATWDLLTARA